MRPSHYFQVISLMFLIIGIISCKEHTVQFFKPNLNIVFCPLQFKPFIPHLLIITFVYFIVCISRLFLISFSCCLFICYFISSSSLEIYFLFFNFSLIVVFFLNLQTITFSIRLKVNQYQIPILINKIQS